METVGTAVRCGRAEACPQVRRGRPKQLTDAEREEMILDAMERVLVARGLKGASMAAIARAAGMSKRTLYEVFKSRDELFEACVRRIRASIVRPLSAEDVDRPVAERLHRILMPDARHAADETPVAVLRAVMAEAPAHPDLARRFMKEGPEEARRLIARELDRAVGRGEVDIADTELAADLLCGMAYVSPIDRLVAIDRPSPSPAEIDRRLTAAIRVFLHGVAR